MQVISEFVSSTFSLARRSCTKHSGSREIYLANIEGRFKTQKKKINQKVASQAEWALRQRALL